jgi:hypothetical protein
MTVLGGSRNSRPGRSGLVTTVSVRVGDGIVTACAMSRGVIQIEYVSAVVFPAMRSTPTSYMPYTVRRWLAVPPSIISS